MRIGIDLGGSKIEGICLDDTGHEVDRQRVPTPRDDYDATLTAITDLVSQLDPEGQTSVGVGMPGAIDPTTGLIKNANSTWLIDHPLDQDLSNLLGRPVRLQNDANCFALSEATDGAGKDADVVFGVILGTGVGGGLVVHGRVLTGPNAIAGEWGHNALPWPNPAEDEPPRPCYCGLQSCIETYLSGPALEAEYEALSGNRLTATEMATQSDNPIAEGCLARYESRLARGLAHVVNVVDPDVIVLGGGLSKLDRLYQNVPQYWTQWVMSDQVATKLLPNKHGDSSGVRGAAWLWPQKT